MNADKTPYWRLSTFYLVYFGSLGAIVPYWSVYLGDRGFSPIQIGELMAVLMAAKFVAPTVWGWISDKTGHRLTIVRIAAFAAVFCFAGVFVEFQGAGDFVWMLVVMTGFSFFWHAALPQIEATTLDHLGDDSHLYARVRLWGSVGFIVTVVAFGPLLDVYGIGLLPLLVIALYLLIWLTSLSVPDASRKAHADEQVSILNVMRSRPIMALFLGTFLLQISHGPYYTFFTPYMESFGFSKSLIGPLWAWGVLAEIGVFLLMHRLMGRFHVHHMLAIAMLLTSIRWIAVALYGDSLMVMIAAQTLHAASYGLAHATAIHLVHLWFTGRHQVRGQAFYSSLSFGAGGAVGNLGSGFLWEGVGPELTYLIAGVAALLAYAAIRLGIRIADTRVSV